MGSPCELETVQVSLPKSPSSEPDPNWMEADWSRRVNVLLWVSSKYWWC